MDETQELVNIYDRDSDPEHINNAATPAEWSGSIRSAPDTFRTPSAIAHPTPLRTNSTDTPLLTGDFPSPTKRRKLDSPFSFSDVFHNSPESNSRLVSSPAASHHRLRDSFSTTSGHEPFRDILNGADSFEPLEQTQSHTSDFATGYSAVSETLARIYLEAPAWPLQDRHEAHLMRYFIDNLACSFDLCDPDRHFALVVPQRAAVCPTLLNAIFAASARHLSRVSDFDPYVADRYHQECLKHLIPMLNDSAAIMDENLLAATVILRFLEEVEGRMLLVSPESLAFLHLNLPSEDYCPSKSTVKRRDLDSVPLLCLSSLSIHRGWLPSPNDRFPNPHSSNS